MSLKYLFTAVFDDGEVFLQNLEDISEIDPSKSAFFDLLAKGKEIDSFFLYENLIEQGYGVNLKTGQFFVGGYLLTVGESLPDRGTKLKLIFYRQHVQSFGDIEKHTVKYFFGYEYLKDGKNIKQVIGIE